MLQLWVRMPPQRKVDLVLDAGPTRYNKPSTMLKVTADGYELVRAGVYDERIIERMLRTVERNIEEREAKAKSSGPGAA